MSFGPDGVASEQANDLVAVSRDEVENWRRTGLEVVPLTAFARHILASQFPTEFDLTRVRLRSGGALWQTMKSLDTLFNRGRTAAMALGWSVLDLRPGRSIPGGFDQLNLHDLALLVHEITHIVQQQHVGGLFPFLLRYAPEYSLGYEKNYGVKPFIESAHVPDSIIGIETIREFEGRRVTYDNIADLNRAIFLNRYGKR
ncbi:MAG: hypothetical protein H7A21_16155 [Spirochaetales bacterium]|nr:hypothetical protein [Leptospiraceae bacterium]MCP5482970.1 hypothetical protein [Spirochaetales bacterium]MCP5484851.1 hypothetical protein [Spirochaetales bacterium]